MALSVTHSFVSAKSDGADPTFVQPSKWNANHVLSQLPGTILGAVAGGGGQTIELPISIGSDGYTVISTTAAVRGAVGTTGQRPLIPVAGDERFNSTTGAKEYYNGTLWVTISAAVPTGTRFGFTGKKTSCPAGWVVSDGGTIGDALSNATNRHDPDTQNLFTLLFNDYADTELALKTSGGVVIPRSTYASAALAFAAHTQVATPNYTDAFGIGLGGTQAPVPGKTGGAAQVTLNAFNLPPHEHGVPYGIQGPSTLLTGGLIPQAQGGNTDSGPGLSTPFSVMNPFVGETAIIKL